MALRCLALMEGLILGSPLPVFSRLYIPNPPGISEVGIIARIL